jgi:hypothetical protein
MLNRNPKPRLKREVRASGTARSAGRPDIVLITALKAAKAQAQSRKKSSISRMKGLQKTKLLTGLGFQSMPSTNTGMTKNGRSKLASELETNLGRRERRIRNPLNIFTQLLLREEKHVGKTAKEMIRGRLK